MHWSFYIYIKEVTIMVNEKCLIEQKGECVLKDETAIVLAITTTLTVALFVAGSTILTSLFSQLPKR